MSYDTANDAPIDDEQLDTCRICSGPAEPDQPLFHPCKCSGTIRYIHQECLTTWLQHSKKKSCDVCKTVYGFENVYDPYMPRSIPPLLFLRRFTWQLLEWVLILIRFAVVATIWLAALPYATVMVWRFYFWTGDLIAWSMYDESPPEPRYHSPTLNTTSLPSSLPTLSSTSAVRGASTSFLVRTFGLSDKTYSNLVNLGSDIFTGQIIAALVMLLFLGIFLLREWIVQNARPDMFGPGVGAEGDAEEDPEAPPPIQGVPAPDIAPAPAPVAQAIPLPLPNVANAQPPHAVFEPIDYDNDEDPEERLERRFQQVVGMHLARNGEAPPLPRPPYSPNDPLAIDSAVLDMLSQHDLLTKEDRAILTQSRPNIQSAMVNSQPNNGQGSGQSHEGQKGKNVPRLQMTDYNDPLMFIAQTPVDETSSTNPFSSSLLSNSTAPPTADTTALSLSHSTSSLPLWSSTDPSSSTSRVSSEFWLNGVVPDEEIEEIEYEDEDPEVDIRWDALKEALKSNVGRHRSDTIDTWMSGNDAALEEEEAALDDTINAATDNNATPIQVDIRVQGPFESFIDLGPVVSPVFDLKSPTAEAYASGSSVSAGYASAIPLPPSPSMNIRASAKAFKLRAQSNSPLTAPSSSFTLTLPQSNSALTRDEFPPPSPRPSHARPSPLPSSSAAPTPIPTSHSKSYFTSHFSDAATAPTFEGDESQDPSSGALDSHRGNDSAESSSSLRHWYISPNEKPTEKLQLLRMPYDPLRRAEEQGRVFDGNAVEGQTEFELDREDEDDEDVEDEEGEEDEEEEDGENDEWGEEDDADLIARGEFIRIRPDEEGGNAAFLNVNRFQDRVAENPQAALERLRGEIEEANAAIAQADAELEAAQAEADEAEAGDDDFEGLLEAVGMRGPIVAIVQNVALMTFILNITIAISIWWPYVIGKSVALNLMKPRRFLAVIHFPIWIVRLITDPIVDTLIWFLRPALDHASRGLSGVYVLRSTTQLNFTSVPVMGPLLTRLWTNPSTTKPLEPAVNRLSFVALLRQLHPMFDVSHNVTLLLVKIAQFWQTHAQGTNSRSRVFAIVLGYIISANVLYLIGSGIVSGSLAKTVRRNIAQILVELKVAVFIAMELAAFPFGCGVVLDVATLPMFEGATIATRLAYSAYAPTSAVFIHWMVGTMFMYQFAALLGSARNILRSGAMWFIKDPQDPSFHPIRDILDRPTMSQLRKLGLSALMYSCVIGGGIGFAIVCIHYVFLWADLFPLRWNTRQTISEIPIDLLFLQLVMPRIIRSADFSLIAGVGFKYACIWTARQLRLTSYLFGDSSVDEQIASRFTWRRLPFIQDLDFVKKGEVEAEAVFDGSHVRGPANDFIPIPEGRRQMLVPTDKEGNALDAQGAQHIQDQDQASQAAHRDPKEDYTVIYIPPHFRSRLIAFVFILWVMGVTVAGLSLGAPILTGRWYLRVFTRKVPTHDGYAFMVGAFVLWVTWKMSIAIRTIHGRIRARSADEATKGYVSIISRALGTIPLTLAKGTYMLLMCGLILPLLLAFVVELYILIPIRAAWYGADIRGVTIYIWEDWALGLVLASIAHSMARMQRPAPPRLLEWRNINRDGIEKLDVQAVTRDFIGPIFGGMLAMIVFPSWIPFAISKLVPDSEPIPIRSVYPWIFVIASVVLAFGKALSMIDMWSQRVRDEEYLLERRLQNFDEATQVQADAE